MSEHSARVYRGHDSYRRPGSHSDSRDRELALSETTKKHAVKLAICVFLFLIMLAVKLIMPTTIADLSSRVLTVVSGDVNYKAAVSTLGEAISGEKKLSDALSEAYYYAFWISSDEGDSQVSNASSENKKDDTKKTEDISASENSPEPDQNE